MHYHAVVTLTAKADTREELIAELSLHCQHLPRKLVETLDQWNTEGTDPTDGMTFEAVAMSGAARGHLVPHMDPEDN